MDNTFIDEIVEYPIKALHVIGNDLSVVKLLTDSNDITLDSDDAYSVFDKFLFDYQYVDDTTQESAAYICVEAEIPRVPTPTIKNMVLYVTIICHKEFMQINHTEFPGIIGNRRDNLARYVDKLINGSDIFGIGKMKLDSARTIPAPKGFTSRELIYRVPDFSQRDNI